jgi:hypothetical protein
MSKKSVVLPAWGGNMKFFWYGFLSCLLLALPSCSLRFGPKTVARDRFDYSSALSTSWKEQMLLNLVKVRYMDAPTFLDVAQVVTTYTFERSGSMSLPDWSGSPVGPAAGVSGRWAESPTITYNPVVGERFTKSMLQPISPITLFSLVQIGWPIDSIFSVGVRAINGQYATTNVELLKKTGSPDFYRLLALLRKLQMTEAFALRMEPRGTTERAVVVFRRKQIDEEAESSVREVRRLLGLSPDIHEFELAYGTIQKDEKEIAMATRSLLEILAEASAGVEVPAVDVKEGRVLKLPEKVEGEAEMKKFNIRVCSSADKPNSRDAYATINYRGKWFWVDDRDLRSKRSLGFLLTLFTLTESGTTATPPVLTISKP